MRGLQEVSGRQLIRDVPVDAPAEYFGGVVGGAEFALAGGVGE
jgi:hypothetical protein